MVQDWSSSSSFVWNVDVADIGPNVVIAVSVRNDDGNDYQGSYMGDDYTYAIYEVTSPTISPATLTAVTDSLGNVNTNSWSKGTGGGWSCSPNCPDLTIQVDEVITISAEASDPNGRP